MTMATVQQGSQEQLLQLAWQVSAVLLGLIGLLTIQILAASAWFTHKGRRQNQFRSRWEPILATAADGVPAELPELARRDFALFLHLWNYIQESLLDEARVHMNELAVRLGAVPFARRRLRIGRVRDRLIAITALGHLGDDESWAPLTTLAASDDPVVSLAAVRSLFRIDPARAAGIFIPRIPSRPDWSLSGLAGILAEAGPNAISKSLADAAVQAAPDQAPRLVRLLDLAHGNEAVRAVRHIIATATDTDVITACLRVFEDPEDLDRVRSLLDDSRWQVRLQAVSALARMGTAEDEDRLVTLLADPEWWVRYRAAQGLAAMPFVPPERLRDLSRELPDPFARDILAHVMAEEALAC